MIRIRVGRGCENYGRNRNVTCNLRRYLGTMSGDASGVHLIVLQHGLWGKSENLNFLEKLLSDYAAKHGHSVRVLNSNVNEGTHTYDGVDLGGGSAALPGGVSCPLSHAGAQRPLLLLLLHCHYDTGDRVVQLIKNKAQALADEESLQVGGQPAPSSWRRRLASASGHLIQVYASACSQVPCACQLLSLHCLSWHHLTGDQADPDWLLLGGLDYAVCGWQA